MHLVCCLSKIMYKYTPMWALNEGRSGCGYSLWNIPPEIKWTRVEGIQKQVLWIEVCFLQTRLAIFCVPLPSVHSFSLSPTPSRALLSRGKVSRVKSVSRGSTGDAKLTRKTVQKALHSCCEVAPWAQCHKLHFFVHFHRSWRGSCTTTRFVPTEIRLNYVTKGSRHAGGYCELVSCELCVFVMCRQPRFLPNFAHLRRILSVLGSYMGCNVRMAPFENVWVVVNSCYSYSQPKETGSGKKDSSPTTRQVQVYKLTVNQSVYV